MKMRSSVIVVLVTATVLADPGLLRAQGRPQQKPQPTKAAPKDETTAAEQAHRRLVAELKLTDSQDRPVREALAAYRRDNAAWLEKNGPEVMRLRKQMGKFHATRDPETVKAVKAAMVEFTKLEREQAAIKKTLLARLKELLTEEQFAKAQAVIDPAPKRPAPTSKFHHLGRLGLTKEQLAKIKTIMAEARPAAGKPPAMGDPMNTAWNKIVIEVLTDKDRVGLAGLIKEASHRKMVMAMFGNVQLTREQAARIDAIWAKAFKDASKTPDKRFEIYSAAQQLAIKDVLTDAQRAQLPTGHTKNPIPMGHPPRQPTTAPARTPRPLPPPLPPVETD